MTDEWDTAAELHLHADLDSQTPNALTPSPKGSGRWVF